MTAGGVEPIGLRSLMSDFKVWDRVLRPPCCRCRCLNIAGARRGLHRRTCGPRSGGAFSAAIPFQGGHHHVNEQWPDYWARYFKSHRFEAIDVIRPRVWNDPEVSSWSEPNVLIFARDDAIRAGEHLRDAWRATSKGPRALVHPEFFLGKVKGAHPGFGRWLRMAPKALRHSLGRRFRRKGARDS